MKDKETCASHLTQGLDDTESVNVLKVNGVDNEEEAVAEATTPVFVLNTLPRHRSLLEEYTGLWCGWCPRGFVALELLKEQ